MFNVLISVLVILLVANIAVYILEIALVAYGLVIKRRTRFDEDATLENIMRLSEEFGEEYTDSEMRLYFTFNYVTIFTTCGFMLAIICAGAYSIWQVTNAYTLGYAWLSNLGWISVLGLGSCLVAGIANVTRYTKLIKGTKAQFAQAQKKALDAKR